MHAHCVREDKQVCLSLQGGPHMKTFWQVRARSHPHAEENNLVTEKEIPHRVPFPLCPPPLFIPPFPMHPYKDNLRKTGYFVLCDP